MELDNLQLVFLVHRLLSHVQQHDLLSHIRIQPMQDTAGELCLVVPHNEHWIRFVFALNKPLSRLGIRTTNVDGESGALFEEDDKAESPKHYAHSQGQSENCDSSGLE